jgi:hypothetical protein
VKERARTVTTARNLKRVFIGTVDLLLGKISLISLTPSPGSYFKESPTFSRGM